MTRKSRAVKFEGTVLWFGKWHEEFGKFLPEHSKFPIICILMGCFSPKYIMLKLRKNRGIMFDGNEHWCKFWRKTDLCFQKWHDEIDKMSPEHVRKSKNCNFYWIFLSKVEMYEFKISRGVMYHDNKEWFKIWRGLDLSVQNRLEEINKFWPKHSEISKFCFLLGCFWQSI